MADEERMNDFVNSNTIPAWFVAIMLVLTGVMWIVTRRKQIRMDSRIFAFTLVLEGIVYGVVYQILDVDVEVRGFVSRLMVVVLCLSQFLPLTISFIRSIKRGY